MHPGKDVVTAADVAAHERDMRLQVGRVFVDVDVERTVVGGQLGRRNTPNTFRGAERRTQRSSQTCADLMQHSRNNLS
jgi:hypothetical protein